MKQTIILPRESTLRQVGGGWFAQGSDNITPEDLTFNFVWDKTPCES